MKIVSITSKYHSGWQWAPDDGQVWSVSRACVFGEELVLIRKQ